MLPLQHQRTQHVSIWYHYNIKKITTTCKYMVPLQHQKTRTRKYMLPLQHQKPHHKKHGPSGTSGSCSSKYNGSCCCSNIVVTW
ncbi:hypothetical protein PGABG02_0003400 [Plasmodium sp. DRC-Itaito]|nr:hypothetical protein PGABG02_0003400 [Plasmodium sp. DRC-Itaito]